MSRRAVWASAGALLAIVAVVYAPTVSPEAGFVWDDHILISENTLLGTDAAWWRAVSRHFFDAEPSAYVLNVYWRPLSKLFIVAMHAVAGKAPAPYHWANLILHSVNTLLVFAWLRRRVRDEHSDDPVIPAFVGALFFAIHTSRYEVVAWISCAGDLLSTLGVLGALLLIRERNWGWALVCSSMAALSKESVMLVPVVVAFDGWLLPSQRLPRKGLFALTLATWVPMAGRLLFGIPFTAYVTHTPLPQVAERVLGSIGAFTLRLLPGTPTLVPVEVNPITDGAWAVPTWLWVLGAAVSVLFVALAVAAVRRPSVRPWAADAFLWAILLFPVLQIRALPSVNFAGDRYQYLPLLGACSLVSRLGVAAFQGTFVARVQYLIATLGLAGVSTLLLASALPSFHSDWDLFEREVRLHPGALYPMVSYAATLNNARQFQAAFTLNKRIYELEVDSYRRSLSLMRLVKNRAWILRDADRDELTKLSRFVDDAFTLGVPNPSVEIDGQRLAAPIAVNLGEALFVAHTDFPYRLLRMMLHWRLGERSRPLKEAETLLEEQPSNQTRLLVIQALVTRQEWSKARERARRFVGVAPELANEPEVSLLLNEPLPVMRPPLDPEWVDLQVLKHFERISAFNSARDFLNERKRDQDAEPKALRRQRIRIEVLDRNFDGALALLDAELARNPEDEEMRQSRMATLALQEAARRADEDEMKLVDLLYAASPE